MAKVFLDANVYFSASRSPKGGSAAILKLIESKKLIDYATKEVLREAELNIRLKEPLAARLRFYELLTEIKPRMITISKKQARVRFLKIINRKDTYVLEGARNAKVEYLVTLDRKHFFTKIVKQSKLPFEILTPGELLREFAEKYKF